MFNPDCKKCRSPFPKNKTFGGNNAFSKCRFFIHEYKCLNCGHYNILTKRKGYKEWDKERQSM